MSDDPPLERLGQGRFFGEPVRQRGIKDLALIDSTYVPGLLAPRHTHERNSFCLVLEGGFEEEYGRRSRRCGRSSVLFRPADEEHADHFVAGARCLNIELGPEWSKRLEEIARPPPASVDVTRTPIGMLALRLYGEFRTGDDCSVLTMEGIALEMLGALVRHADDGGSKRPAWLGQVEELLRERVSAHMSAAEMAELVGVHPVHMARVFRRHQRCTIGDFRRQLRIERACELLMSSRLTLAEIAVEAGFSHQSHFSNALKGTTGLTPAEYRARHRR